MLAALFGRAELFTRLVAAGAGPDATDESDNSAMSVARSQGKVEMQRIVATALRHG
jgi:hypothetical protein